MVQQFYSDRTRGPVLATHELIPENTRNGLLGLIGRRIDSDWLAEEFPAMCGDGNGVAGTNNRALEVDVAALIPTVSWPLFSAEYDDEELFDLIEYFARRVSRPVQGGWHSFLRHYELSFKKREGQAEFRDEVNELLRRGGTVFALSADLQIQRVGSPELQALVRELRPNSGDSTLDELVEEGRALYLSRHERERATAIEKLWDAFERLKTLEPPHVKPASAEALLGHIADADMREIIRSEMRALTDFGNNFRIRHAELNQIPIPDSALDYVAGRMMNLLILLLSQRGWIDPD